PRPAERLGEAALTLASPFLVGPLRKFRAVSADAVAAALIASVRGRSPGKRTLESDALGAHLVE
ncbi:MAG: oxidoreductase, partial [Elusimicrobia bacterium]|nr:oxidoreductase [Elusimicrobiota bacterium]